MASAAPGTLKSRRHPEFTEYETVFNLYYATYKGGHEILKSITTYMLSHRLEAPDDYTKRQQRAFYLNYCKRVVDAYTNFIFKSGIKRSEDNQLALFFENADGMGGTIDEVMKKVSCLSSVYGRVDCIVDAPQKDTAKQPISVRQAKEGNLLPYVILRSALETIDWSLDYLGALNWVLYKYTFYTDEDPSLERDTSNMYRYKLITKTDWLEFDESENTIGSGTNELQEVFVHRCYNKSDSGILGTSLLTDISYINKEILNWCSLISEQIYRQTFSQLVVPDDGEYFADNYKSKSDVLGEGATNLADFPELRSNSFSAKVGNSWAFTYPAGAGQPPSYISPSRDQIDVIWKMIESLVAEIYRVAGLGSSEGKEVSSGRAQQRQFLTVDSSLKAKAETLERAENEIIRLFCLRQGVEFKDEFKSVYPKDFDVLSFIESLDSELKVVTAGFSTALNKYMLKRVANKFVDEAPIAVKNEVMKEIESGDGTILVMAGGGYVRIGAETENTNQATQPIPGAVPGQVVPGAGDQLNPDANATQPKGPAGGIVPTEAVSTTKRRTVPGETPSASKVRRAAGVDNRGNPRTKK